MLFFYVFNFTDLFNNLNGPRCGPQRKTSFPGEGHSAEPVSPLWAQTAEAGTPLWVTVGRSCSIDIVGLSAKTVSPPLGFVPEAGSTL